MKRKAIKRRVISLDTSNQLSLLGNAMPAPEAAPAAATTGKPATRMRFEAPRPESIFVNQTRLDEHLKRVGQREPLRVRGLLVHCRV
jgi:hypothetical protein